MTRSAFFSVLALLALPVAGCAEETTMAPAAAPRARRVILVAEPAVVVQPVPGTPTVVEAPAVVESRPASRVVVEKPPVVAPAAPAARSIDSWNTRHSAAAKELGVWVHDNPEAAKRLFESDTTAPDRSRALIGWAVHHPSDDVMVFVKEHPDWKWFDTVTTNHKVGSNQLLSWARANPAAAEELVSYPSGLRWAGDHLYASDWRQ